MGTHSLLESNIGIRMSLPFSPVHRTYMYVYTYTYVRLYVRRDVCRYVRASQSHAYEFFILPEDLDVDIKSIWHFTVELLGRKYTYTYV